MLFAGVSLCNWRQGISTLGVVHVPILSCSNAQGLPNNFYVTQHTAQLLHGAVLCAPTPKHCICATLSRACQAHANGIAGPKHNLVHGACPSCGPLQIGSTLTRADSAAVTFMNGAQACNVFYLVRACPTSSPTIRLCCDGLDTI